MPTRRHITCLLVLATGGAVSCGEHLELCDPAAADVSFHELGTPSELEGRWVGSLAADPPTDNEPAELIFDAEGRPQRFRPEGWNIDMIAREQYLFGCDAFAFPLELGASNLVDRLDTDGDWDRRTLEEVETEAGMITLYYLVESGPSDQRFVSWTRWTLRTISNGRIEIDLASRSEDDTEWNWATTKQLHR